MAVAVSAVHTAAMIAAGGLCAWLVLPPSRPQVRSPGAGSTSMRRGPRASSSSGRFHSRSPSPDRIERGPEAIGKVHASPFASPRLRGEGSGLGRTSGAKRSGGEGASAEEAPGRRSALSSRPLTLACCAGLLPSAALSPQAGRGGSRKRGRADTPPTPRARAGARGRGCGVDRRRHPDQPAHAPATAADQRVDLHRPAALEVLQHRGLVRADRRRRPSMRWSTSIGKRTPSALGDRLRLQHHRAGQRARAGVGDDRVERGAGQRRDRVEGQVAPELDPDLVADVGADRRLAGRRRSAPRRERARRARVFSPDGSPSEKRSPSTWRITPGASTSAAG